MRKLLAIVLKDMRITFNERIALIFMFAAPLVISLVIGAAFGSLSDSDVAPLFDIEVVVVNQDEGAMMSNLGDSLVSLLVEQPTEDIDRLLDARTLDGWVDEADREEADDWAEAKRLVENGDVVAAILVPQQFSAQAIAGTGEDAATIEVYYNQGESVFGRVVRDVVQRFVTQVSTSTIAIPVGNAHLESPAAQGELLQQVMGGEGELAPVTLEQGASAGGEQDEVSAMSLVAPSMAIFFMTFMVTQSAADLLRERQQWTLQRTISTPTPRIMILVGKLVSTYIIGVIQVLILWGATTALGASWGSEIVAVVLVILAVVLAGSGLGTLICGIASRPQHVDVYGTALLMLMGIASGTFTSPDFLGDFNWISKLTPNYWGIKGFNALTEGSSLADVVPNLVVLVLMGVVLFLIGVWRFNRHLDVQ